MNLPNRLTVARAGMAGFFVALFLSGTAWGAWSAWGVFLMASFTDWLDGWLARRSGQITRLGEFLDPLADKVLVAAGMIVCLEVGRAPGWVVIVVIAREYAVTGLRMALVNAGRRVPAARLGKWKTAAQMVYLALAVLAEALRRSGWGAPVLDGGAWIILWVALVLTLVSGIEVFHRNGAVLKEEVSSKRC